MKSKLNDLDLTTWKESCQGIWTDSLWDIQKRDTSGAHKHGSSYHGNFVPQIPRQLIWRYTKVGDLVIDPFMGGGTTLIEAQRQGRHCIGIELNAAVADAAMSAINQEKEAVPGTLAVVGKGDARTFDLTPTLEQCSQAAEQLGVGQRDWTAAQLVIMHPPYHDIIRFTEGQEGDLSCMPTVPEFLEGFGQCVDNVCQYLEKGRYLAVVCGDKYEKGEWIPLGFQVMQQCLKRSFLLKSIVVKNMAGNEVGKGVNNGLWRYRALAGGFYVFKHEYLFLLQKTK